MQIKKFILAAILFSAASFLAGCGPAIVVQNNTKFPVRVVVATGGKSEMLSPSPGESSAAEASEGAYGVYVIPDEEWIAYAKLTRQYLNDQLANSDKLTGPQLLNVIQRLKDIAERMHQYERAAGSGNGCSGRVTSDGGGAVTISTRADGGIVVSCR